MVVDFVYRGNGDIHKKGDHAIGAVFGNTHHIEYRNTKDIQDLVTEMQVAASQYPNCKSDFISKAESFVPPSSFFGWQFIGIERPTLTQIDMWVFSPEHLFKSMVPVDIQGLELYQSKSAYTNKITALYTVTGNIRMDTIAFQLLTRYLKHHAVSNEVSVITYHGGRSCIVAGSTYQIVYDSFGPVITEPTTVEIAKIRYGDMEKLTA